MDPSFLARSASHSDHHAQELKIESRWQRASHRRLCWCEAGASADEIRANVARSGKSSNIRKRPAGKVRILPLAVRGSAQENGVTRVG